MGRDGEKVVGQLLTQFIADDAYVFHDIPCNGFNIDHVVIHPNGIFVIETKTYAKPLKGRSELVHEGNAGLT